MNVDVENPQLLISQASSLKQEAENIDSLCSQIRECCDQISEAWTSDTEDRNSYLNAIYEDLDTLAKLKSATVKYSGVLSNYASSLIKQEQQGGN